jgi:2'-5' RNA ligase
MRLFLAIYPTKQFLDYFRDVKRGLDKEKRNLRYVDPERLHVTLKFIGSDVTSATKNLISVELQRHAGSYPKPEIAIDDVALGFAYQDDPRVVMANIKANDELDELVGSLHRYIRELKRRDTIRWKERNDASYHVSLARLKPAATRSSGRSVDTLIENLRVELPPPKVGQCTES